ncbi:hypothetical protein CIB84_006334 [Bambusicola thoracicus]|uniref:Uncharacterized protein n=1 Tax=Bambusicola thoracicus TaxID=9083 RepID=A0A2P4T0P8_BAMTH|nr:hypothetical protein CIB84_006334 [Bambusicola thoracicus]
MENKHSCTAAALSVPWPPGLAEAVGTSQGCSLHPLPVLLCLLHANHRAC